jgi:hypothetical protein
MNCGAWNVKVPRIEEKKLQIPPLPPDFLSSLVGSANFMRLSSMKAAYVVIGGAA